MKISTTFALALAAVVVTVAISALLSDLARVPDPVPAVEPALAAPQGDCQEAPAAPPCGR